MSTPAAALEFRRMHAPFIAPEEPVTLDSRDWQPMSGDPLMLTRWTGARQLWAGQQPDGTWTAQDGRGHVVARGATRGDLDLIR